MKNYSIPLTPRQLEEIRNLLLTIVAQTEVLHSLNYSECYTFYNGYMKLIKKCHAGVFRNRRKKYKTSFVPAEAEAMAKIFYLSKLRLTPYASAVVISFVGAIDKQSQDFKTTFLSQHPIDTPDAQHPFSKKFRDRPD